MIKRKELILINVLTTCKIKFGMRCVLGFVASLNLELEQLDVNTAFLHYDLNKASYVEQLEGLKRKGKNTLFVS